MSALMRSDKGILFDDAHNIVGGRQMLNETIYQALEREVKEETGYDIDDSYFVGIAEDIVELPKYHGYQKMKLMILIWEWLKLSKSFKTCKKTSLVFMSLSFLFISIEGVFHV
ncbi:NUDIX hydrolase [Erysipelothrix sp. Poltava]|nr:NUDIX hydrolase [Erysipelothrix sp. Poltava]